MPPARLLAALTLCSATLCFSGPACGASDTAILEALSEKRWQRAYKLAESAGEPFTRDLATWYYLTHHDTIAPHKLYQRFMARRPGWPRQDKLSKRREIAFLNSRPTARALKRWFLNYPPVSPRGKLRLLDAHDRVHDVHLQTLWIEGDFSAHEERELLVRYGERIPVQSHQKRLERLLWDEREAAARRMFAHVSPGWQALARAWLAIQDEVPGMDRALKRVPEELRDHPGLIFARVRYRAEKRGYVGVARLLKRAPKRLPRAARWWPYQKYVIREAIQTGKLETARTLLSHHSQLVPKPRVEAEWLRGWLHLAYRDAPKEAAPAFINIYETASMPISRSRGAYWAARAYELAGKDAAAKRWYQLASLFPTAFYGQIAHQHLHGDAPLALPATIGLSEAKTARFIKAHPLAAALKRLADAGYAKLVWPLIRNRLTRDVHHNPPGLFAGFAATASRYGAVPLAIRIAKLAQNTGLYLDALHPIPEVTPKDLAVEKALALAVAHQESRFAHTATSAANARGVMQLLPGTARRVARVHDMPYQRARLSQPRYNMRLGSHYLDGLIRRFDGSLILALAGYNAGPTRSELWKRRFGPLSAYDHRRNIRWVESIPFGETRNYIQRVLEHYHVYRHRLQGEGAPLRAREALLEKPADGALNPAPR